MVNIIEIPIQQKDGKVVFSLNIEEKKVTIKIEQGVFQGSVTLLASDFFDICNIFRQKILDPIKNLGFSAIIGEFEKNQNPLERYKPKPTNPLWKEIRRTIKPNFSEIYD
jgi:hypothetical protein